MRRSNKQRPKTIRRARGERGQALIIAVLVMLILGALAGLFIIVVSWGLAQSVIEADRIAAQYLAEAGLRFANDQLTYGAEGADWRPASVDAERWTDWSAYGDGEFRLRITYEPKPDDPLSKFIKIESEGRRAAARRRLVAVKPIFITDYLLYVTNSDKSARRAQLGGGFFVYTTNADGKRTNMGPYKSFWNGPMHFNGELEWFGPQHMSLLQGPEETPDECAQLNDKLEVSRYILQNPEWQSGVQGEHPLTVSVNGGPPQTVGPTYLPSPPHDANTLNTQFTTVGGVYRDGLVAQTDINGFSRAVGYYEAPAIDLGIEGTAGHRYHALTRDSGEWRGGGDTRYNTGWYGYGDGIYIDNFGDRDDAADYEAWRQKWAEAAASGVYSQPPRGVVIWLHPDGTLTLQRDDKDWVDQDDPQQFMGRMVTLPYPKNGVIYAEGNIRIGGVQTASPEKFEVYPNAPYPGYWNNDKYRRYDLTVVSGGTIYIEGALASEGDDITGANLRASKIALLALENVCLDATKVLRPVGAASLEWGPSGGIVVRPGEPYEVEFSTVRMANDAVESLQLLLRHAGTFEPGGYPTQMRLWIDGKLYNWGDSGETTYWLYPTAPWADNSAPVVAPYWEAIPCTEPGVGRKSIDIGDYLDAGSIHRIRFEASGLDYHLYDLTIQPLTVRVDALIYAQRGSWYLLAGPWLDDGDQADQNRLPQQIEIDYGIPGQPGFPRPHEPSDINLVINGAISENRTAPIGDVLTWTQRWRGADEWWQLSDIGTDAPATHGLQYRYDPYLRLNVGANRPRLPRLPVSPVLISVEESANL